MKRVSVKLRTINSLLRRIGLVLVVETENAGKEPISLWVELASTYDKRCAKEKDPIDPEPAEPKR